MKRKTASSTHEGSTSKPPKKSRSDIVKSSKGKAASSQAIEWPEYFNELFKVYKALNTVLAFVSSRKQLAITFPVIRSSVENLLKQPLDLSSVAEMKALLPDLIKFAYIPRNELRIHGDSVPKKGRTNSPDYSAYSGPSTSTLSGLRDTEDHVLVLEFAENSRGKKAQDPGSTYYMPPSLTPAAVKKLVEKRNGLFSQALNELILATPDAEDPVALLKAAGRSHIPAEPSWPGPSSKISAVHMPLTVPDPSHRPEIEAVLVEIEQQPWYKEQIVDKRYFEAREGKTDDLQPPLLESINQALRTSRNIHSLYTHQVAAINALTQGQNVIVSTSTASGKSVIYQVPVLRCLEENPSATAMFVYPTKALAQDQRGALEHLIATCPGLEHIRVSTYDGDTPQEQRAGIRESASVIFTNFDMIHASILPYEDLWRRFLKNLKIFAVDELHYYSGLFGSHVAQIMRRFRRVCAAVGNRRTRFVSCSATITRPKQHMQDIFGIEDVVEVTEDGAPSGPKTFLIWDPPLIDPAEPTLGRQSSLSEAARLMIFLMKRGIRCILFCKIRKVCELAMKTLRTELSNEGRLDILEKTVAYRGGYSPEDRRRIEREAFSGNILGLVATNALELGVDIGVLDAVIMLGFPMTIASFRQQAGRAGRRARDSLAVLVPDAFPVDRNYVKNPQELWDTPMDDLQIDLHSDIIIEAHLQCASHEMPLSLEDEAYFGPQLRSLCETCLIKDKDGWYHPHPKFLPNPARHVSIRGAKEDKYSLIDVTKPDYPTVLEEIEVSRALFEVYEGGVFLHQGMTFMVKEVSHDTQTAKLLRVDVNWITQPRDFTNVDAVQTYRIREIKNSPHRAYYGRVELYTKVYGFYKIRNRAILDVVDLETQPWQRQSTGLWMDLPKLILDLMTEKGINAAEAIHSAQHAFLNQFAMAADLKTECKVAEKEYKASESTRKRPARLIFYDIVNQSGGVAAKAFDRVHDILSRACDVVDRCGCNDGCTKCILSATCKENNEVYSKIGAQLVLRAMLSLRIDVEQIPWQAGDDHFNTVVEAPSVPTIPGVSVEL